MITHERSDVARHGFKYSMGPAQVPAEMDLKLAPHLGGIANRIGSVPGGEGLAVMRLSALRNGGEDGAAKNTTGDAMRLLIGRWAVPIPQGGVRRVTVTTPGPIMAMRAVGKNKGKMKGLCFVTGDCDV